MDYELRRLGTREFEHLAQVLAMRVLGPSLQVFGDGPDGGREATHDGLVQVGTETWDGLTVVQAKFRQRDSPPTTDADWFASELRAELNQWLREDSRRLRRPDHLLFVTNAVLAPVPTVGGLDRVTRILEEYRSKLGYRGFAIWHYDKIRVLLGENRDIRKEFAAFITPSDVLSRIEEMLGQPRPELAKVLTTHSAQELLAQRWVKLGQAGDDNNSKVDLAAVAIDLPARNDEHRGGRIDGLVNSIVERADCACRNSAEVGRQETLPMNVVVLGGPGQGKSTAAQLLCQIYRCAMLEDRPVTSIGPEAASARDGALQMLRDKGFQIPFARRWPMHIDLAKYADRVKGGEQVSILRFIGERIQRRVTPEVSASDIYQWLGDWPWFLVLDGLDEVSNLRVRTNVETAISNLLIEAASQSADLFVLLTTRPQGYDEELSRVVWDHLTLENLSSDLALKSARLLAEVRHRDDLDARESLDRAMRSALEQEGTGKLLQTPLQVSIMSLLLEKRNRAPRDRRSLFEAYYQTIFAREVSKEGDLGDFLEKHKEDIDYLHDFVGIVLQVASESGFDAAISHDTLLEIVKERLTTEEHPERDVERLAHRLVVASTNRLVLLVPSEDGVGYEVRSLQEYTASRALTRGSDEDVMMRLEFLAPSKHWLNTWLFAASYIFSEREWLRDAVISIVRSLDAHDESVRFILPGAELALAIVRDDITSRSPRYQKLLLAHAIEVLRAPGFEIGYRTARFFELVASRDREFRQTINAEIRTNLAGGGLLSMNALRLLIFWVDRDGSMSNYAYQTLQGLKRTISLDDAVAIESQFDRVRTFDVPSDLVDFDPEHSRSSFAATLRPIMEGWSTSLSASTLELLDELEYISPASGSSLNVVAREDSNAVAKLMFGIQFEDEEVRRAFVAAAYEVPAREIDVVGWIDRWVRQWHGRRDSGHDLISGGDSLFQSAERYILESIGKDLEYDPVEEANRGTIPLF